VVCWMRIYLPEEFVPTVAAYHVYLQACYKVRGDLLHANPANRGFRVRAELTDCTYTA
jgi:hypothetical protein